MEKTMTRRLMLSTCAGALLALVMTAPPAMAHPGHDHKVLGTVVSVAADRLVVKDRENKEVTITLNGDTKVMKDKKPVRLDLVKAGDRVVVTAATEGKMTIGKLIDLGAAQPTK
jgi:hypothetical protein